MILKYINTQSSNYDKYNKVDQNGLYMSPAP